MSRAGRSRSTAILKFIVGTMSIFQINASEQYGFPLELKYWDDQFSPRAYMVDLTNEFGLKVLAKHNILNYNNIAFSPYGLVGILLALYEGVHGLSAYEIKRSMKLPWDIDAQRIGFRDIHRTLKTYFVPEEGFLAGLALNNENVTFRESYKKVLQFYGFDLDQFNSNNTNIKTTTASPTTEVANMSSITAEMTDAPAPPTTEPSKEETTLNPNAETIDIRESMSQITSITSPVTESESQSISFTISNTAPVEEAISTTTSSTTVETLTETIPETTTTITTLTIDQSTTPALTDRSTITTDMVTTSTSAATDITQTDISSTSADAEVPTTQTTTETSSTSGSETTEESATNNNVDTTVASTSPPSPTAESLQRRKKSIVEFIYTNPPYIDHSSFRSFDVGIELPNEYNEKFKDFAVNNLRDFEVSYMQYDSVLDHAYLRHLEASALRLPLDSDRYYLLIVLPLRRGEDELTRLVSRMAIESDLADVYGALKPRRVKAVVPSFTVKGHITLTTDLQKLGICEVFEPRQDDFGDMTDQPGVYVRSIEQAVSIVIRKYQPDQLKSRYVANRRPVLFSATYPFLYFVMDSTINVALMAGKMVDPLNTRIL